MNSASEVVQLLANSNYLERLLEEDNKTTKEVGMVLTANGEVRQFKTGEEFEIGFYGAGTGQEPVAIVHTHPRIDTGPTTSQADVETRTWNKGVQSMVVMTRRMFDTKWDGTCLYFGSSTDINDDYEELEFEVVCDGTTEGPSEDRWIDNIRINVKT
jgi:proteasome lid subunit RPN8/RPN11